MEFAINYSHAAARLLAEERIQIDRFKTPDWPYLIAEASGYCAVAVHFNLFAGRGDTQDSDWEQVERLLEVTGTPYVNLHLEPRGVDFPGMPVDTTDPTQTEAVYARMLEDARVVTRRFGAERVIVENVFYRGAAGKAMRPAVEPEVISRLLEETGCGLLLDISHARISAHHLGMDPYEYMSRLPIERVREVHFTGLHNLDGKLVDHLEVLEGDWPVLAWALEQIRSGDWSHPWLLAFEYGGVGEQFEWRSDPRVMAEQVPRLYEMVRRVPR